MKYTKHSKYAVTWRDHFSTEGFFDKEDVDVENEVVLTSLGFFVKEDRNYIHIARTLGEDLYADMMSILKGQILKVEEV